MIQDKSSMTDLELVNLVRSGDGAGLSFVYEKYRKEFMNWIRKFSGCSLEDAQEYYQAATLILYENIMSSKVNLQSTLKTYLFGIGKNLTYQHHRKNQRQERAHAEYMIEVELLNDSRHALEAEIDLRVIAKCLAVIGEPCRQLLDYFYFLRKSMEEISTSMGYKNPETAKNQKYKCMERLRKMVEDERTTNVTVDE